MGYFKDYPKHVFLILANEFCERFSYYGMKVILVLYLTLALDYSDSTAVSIYHAFSAVCYFTPVLGAIIADGYLGKFRTILYVSMIYALGNIAMSVTAIPYGGSYLSWGVFIGLVLIGIGSGGIKPCVSAFGGDQFKPEQTRQKESFFSLFYMFINIGSLLTTLITPYIRSNVFCFDDYCYALAFGIPAILMVISIGVFAIGSPWYVKHPAGDSILSRIFGCVGTALKGKFKCGKSEEEKKEHWLDYAETKYDKQLISDIKDVFGVLWLFLPLPFFWALYDQQGSRWTLQATQMNGDFGSFVMQPDMMGVMNSLMVVVMAPLLESVVFPILTKLRIPNRPLQRMAWGMIFGATAFLMAGFLQIGIDNSTPAKPSAGEAKLMLINSEPCNVSVSYESLNWTDEAPGNYTLETLEWKDYETVKAGHYAFYALSQEPCSTPISYNGSFSLAEKKAFQIVVRNGELGLLLEEQEQLDPTTKSSSTYKFFNNFQYPIDINLHPTKNQKEDHREYNISSKGFSNKFTLVFATFDVSIKRAGTNDSFSKLKQQLKSKNGAVFTILANNQSNSSAADSYTLTEITDLEPRTVNIFLQVPQYLVLTIGECLFSITGLGFAYSQAPATMKSLLTAAWLLTVAFGNLIIIIIAETTSDSGDEAFIFFLFAGLLYVVTVIFAIMSYFYKYVTPRNFDQQSMTSSSSGSSDSDVEKKPYSTETFGEKTPMPDDLVTNEKVRLEAEADDIPPKKDGHDNLAMSDDSSSEKKSISSDDDVQF